MLALAFECFGGYSDDVLLLGVGILELRLDVALPIPSHDFLDTCFAQSCPFVSQSRFAHRLEGFINEYTSTEIP